MPDPLPAANQPSEPAPAPAPTTPPPPPAPAAAGPVLTVPELALVLLVGPSGCGKSTFALRHFKPTEIVSSDSCRGIVCDDETDQSATREAFDLLHHIVGVRLRRGRLTVVDATNVRADSRKQFIELARAHDVLPVAIVFNLPERVCIERNRHRPGRDFGPHVVRVHCRELRSALRSLRDEGFRYVYVLDSDAAIAGAEVRRTRLWTDKRDDHGPFDLIGDVHGCGDELDALLDRLGYRPDPADGIWRHPAGRRAIFLGDLVDRGPRVVEVVRRVMAMTRAGAALCVPGNHDLKLMRHLRGKTVRITHGLDASIAQIAALPEAERAAFVPEYCTFADRLVSHFVLDDGKLVVAHAGMREDYQGRASARVRDFALYGETTGETDEFGLPVRLDWAASYRGRAYVAYGHTPTVEAEWLNGTINLDTGCVFGGKLSALRYPERELVSVPARRQYVAPAKPLAPPPSERHVAAAAATPAPSLQWRHDDLLHLEDVHGKRVVETRLVPTVTIPPEHAAAALEIMSRFAADPRWLVYLPPTMSPGATSRLPGLLEHPAEVFRYFAESGVARVVCEEKHMGSRAVLVVCRDAEAACRRFGAVNGRRGAIVTRTGRAFFESRAMEEELLERVRAAWSAAGLWAELATDWAVLDAEVLPWNAKARALVEELYAPVGTAGAAALAAARAAAEAATARGVPAGEVAARLAGQANSVDLYRAAYRRYCWEVQGLAGVRVAPFHVLATEGKAHVDRNHLWHLALLARLAAADPTTFLATAHREIPLADPAAVAAGTAWWEELTARGGEGMVVKPLDFVTMGRRGVIQPAVKCRGREYLRIIYGPGYTDPEQLDRLRERGLGHKRSLATREFALGVEALERFARGEPLRRVHECVFGVLALESEPVDPRL
ncbi:MAG: polynucleotide kinase-phosphatase [Planctomycetes bacterium]|nr:polynucleotide kinase-phosphatase [Planctomycetota bacterium]